MSFQKIHNHLRTGKSPFNYKGLALFSIVILFAITGNVFINSFISTATTYPAITAGTGPTFVPSAFFGQHLGDITDQLIGIQTPPFTVKSIRLWGSGTDWCDLNPVSGKYNWTNLDPWFTQATKEGADLLFTFGNWPAWATDTPSSLSSSSSGSNCLPLAASGAPLTPNVDAWKAYVTAVVSHSKGKIKYYELWNEANLTNWWPGSIDQIVQLNHEAAVIIHSLDPDAKVLSPSISVQGGVLWLKQYLSKIPKGDIDIIAFHGYIGASPETIISFVNNIRSAMSGAGYGTLPLWDTEGSWARNELFPGYQDPQVQRAFVARFTILQASLGINRFYWYRYDDPFWGTLWKDKRLTAAGVAMAQLTKWLGDATITSPCSRDTTGFWKCSISKPGGYAGQILWMESGTTTITTPSGFKYINYLDGTGLNAGTTVTVTTVPLLIQNFIPKMDTFFGQHFGDTFTGAITNVLFKVKAIRLWDNGASWCELNTSYTKIDWANLDVWFDQATIQNADLLYTFGRVPLWASTYTGDKTGITNCTPYGNSAETAYPNQTAWKNFVTAVANHGKGKIKYYELWNDPTQTTFWTGTLSQMIQMSHDAAQIIHSVDPTAKVLSPSVSIGKDTWLQQYLAQIPKGDIDIIAYHGYVGSQPEDLIAWTGKIRDAMAATGYGTTPLWDTEGSWGKNTSLPGYSDANVQRAFVGRYEILHTSLGVERFYWYRYSNPYQSTSELWGTLWKPITGPTPAGVAMRQVIGWLGGASFTAPCNRDATSGLWSCTISRSGTTYTGQILWMESGTTTITTPSGFKFARYLDGTSQTLGTNVDVGTVPVLIENFIPN